MPKAKISEPAATAPLLSDTAASVNGQCATVTGTVIDNNQNLSANYLTFNYQFPILTFYNKHKN